MVTLNPRAQVFVVGSVIVGVIIGVALSAQERSWGAYAGSGAMVALDLVYRATHASPSGKSRWLGTDTGGVVYGALPVWVFGAVCLAFFLFVDHQIAARKARAPANRTEHSAPLIASATGSHSPSVRA
jgi:hypothetical protein